VDQLGTVIGGGSCEMPRRHAVHLERRGLVRLRSIDISPSSTVDDSLRPELGKRSGHENRIRHLNILHRPRWGVVLAALGRQHDITSQHSAGTDDEDAHQGIAISELSPTIKR
jgi:hypothetical protein